MANAFWPATLPQRFIAEDFSASVADNVLRSATDAGPHKRRRRYTAPTRRYQGVLLCDSSQLDVFLSFYHDSLADGSLDFDWLDPRDQAAATFAFRSPYSYEPAGGDHWRVTVALERQP